jgi:pimeloyl-ACP methyl ester carboxylesterase
MRRTTAVVLGAVLTGAVVTAALAGNAPVQLKTMELGEGPAIVLVHDLGAGRMSLMPVARKLMGRHHVVLVDLPGHGDSPMPDPFTLQIAADALDGVVARQKGAVVVAGHGVGGVVALLEASAHPERVKGVVVVNAAARSPMDVPDQERKRYQEFMDEHYDDFLKLLFKSAARDSAQGVAVHAQAMLVPSNNVKLYLRELLYLDASAAAKNLKVPMLYVGAGKEWAADLDWPAQAKKFGYGEVKNASGLRVGSSGNFLYLDQPDSLAGAIADFATRVAGGGK